MRNLDPDFTVLCKISTTAIRDYAERNEEVDKTVRNSNLNYAAFWSI